MRELIRFIFGLGFLWMAILLLPVIAPLLVAGLMLFAGAGLLRALGKLLGFIR